MLNVKPRIFQSNFFVRVTRRGDIFGCIVRGMSLFDISKFVSDPDFKAIFDVMATFKVQLIGFVSICYDLSLKRS
jgi:hypothetical protein